MHASLLWMVGSSAHAVGLCSGMKLGQHTDDFGTLLQVCRVAAAQDERHGATGARLP